MTLRKKALLIIGVTLIILIGAIYATSRFVFIEGLTEIEEQSTRRDIEQVQAAMSYVLSELETTTAGWASWDDTYAFIESGSKEYVQSNLVDDTFLTLKLNLMLFIHSSGRVVFGKAFDLGNEEEIPISPSLRQNLADNRLPLSHRGTEGSTSGIILLDEGPMLITSQPILTSDFEGPSRGTLIFGRYLDSVEINRLAGLTLFPITIQSIDDIQMSPDFKKALSSLSEKEAFFVQPLNNRYVAGYTLLRDIFGKPILMLRVDIPRDIYNRGLATVAYYIIAVVAVSLAVAAVTMLIAEKQVMAGFTRLVKGVNRIATSGDISERLSVTGRDELATVAGTINGMLAALQQANEELKELYQNEKGLRQQLETEILKRIEFTRALVHELKTPLTPVVASSELLLEEVKEKPLVDLAQNIYDGASNLNRRIDELLDLAKSEIGTLQVNPMPMDPVSILNDTVRSVMPMALRYRQSLNLELPPSLPEVWADAERFRQVVLNLLNGSFKFSSPGGKITLRAREEGTNLIVEVQDTGRGISEKEQERLFQPYHQAESDRGRLSGLGLGLALSKSVVELHGGQIWVKSREGEGSTFSFSMPLAAKNKRGKLRPKVKS